MDTVSQPFGDESFSLMYAFGTYMSLDLEFTILDAYARNCGEHVFLGVVLYAELSEARRLAGRTKSYVLLSTPLTEDKVNSQLNDGDDIYVVCLL